MVRFDHERSKRDIPPNAHVASNALLLLTPSQECEVISVVPGSGLIRDELMPILVLIPFLVGVRARQAAHPFNTAIAPMLVHFPPLRYPRGVDFSQRNSHRSGRHVPRPCKRSRQAPPSSPCGAPITDVPALSYLIPSQPTSIRFWLFEYPSRIFDTGDLPRLPCLNLTSTWSSCRLGNATSDSRCLR